VHPSGWVRPRVVVGVVRGRGVVGVPVVRVGYAGARGVVLAFLTGACPGQVRGRGLG
jgi:hypothetical protein